jgi:hypothetical protein
MKYKLIVGSFLLAATMGSCKKLIEIKETDFIDPSKAYSTVEYVEQALMGAYAPLQFEMGYLLNATLSDEVKTAGEFYNSVTTHEWQYGSQDIVLRDNFTAYNNYYTVIDRANRVLQAVDKADSMRVGDNTLRAKLKGEALFLRALSHFELARYYSGNYDPAGLALIYMKTPTLAPNARNNMNDYYANLKADLAEAKPLLPNSLADINRANRAAVSGLQARIALYMREWTNAVTYSTEYITALPLATKAEFPGLWTDANTRETAFRLTRTTGYLPYTRPGSIFRNTSAGNNIGLVTWAPSSKLWDTYDQTNDVRFAAYLKHEPILAAAGRQPRLVNKYAGTGYATANENINQIKVFRTGEMYLIRAEAKAELNDATAANDLNDLRDARITGYVPETFATKAALIDAIMLERFKELAFEGHRFFDLRRRNLPVLRSGTDAPSTTGATLPAGNFRFILPIPLNEIQANPLVVQNQGY